jgi:hypothetical protein
MTPPHTPRPSQEDAVPAYEALRHHVLSGATGGGAGGLIVLLRQGVAAWQACRGAAARLPAPAPAAGLPPEERHAALVTLLVNMVLDHPQETGR